MAVGETPGQGRKSGSKRFLEFVQAKTMKCLRFVWFPIGENKQGCQTLETTSKKPFYHVSRDKILHDS